MRSLEMMILVSATQRSAGGTGPHRASGARHQLELLPLILRRDAVPFVRRRETALRADGQPLQRHHARRFADPPANLFIGLEARHLGLTSPSTTVRSSGT